MPTELKNASIMVNLEPTIMGLIIEQTRINGSALSAYIRDLIIADLTDKGTLTAQIWQHIQTGKIQEARTQAVKQT